MNMTNTIPEILLDSNDNPTEEWLEFIRNYHPSEELPLLKFVTEVLPKGWYLAEWGVIIHRKYRGVIRLELHTGGFSGNEEVIREILSNKHFTHFKMEYVQWKTGGHHYFEIAV